jgi:DNA-binding transcriptional LysR family regulator
LFLIRKIDILKAIVLRNSSMELANLDMDVLRTLAVAMDVGGFGKAAERLGRSQSAVSLQMRRLEERVGRPLFRREGRGLALTDAGDVVLGYARQILELNDQAVAAARGIAIGGSVRFGVPQDFGDSWLPGVLARFSRAHPSVLIEVRVDRASKLVERIAEGGLDLALMWGNPSVANTVTVQRLPMVWIGLKGYAVPKGAPVPLALFESPCVFRQPGVEALERTHRPWRLAFTSPSLSGLWAATAAGLGVTVRTQLGLPTPLTVLGKSSGLPKLPQIALSLYTARSEPPQAVARLREILIEELPLPR